MLLHVMHCRLIFLATIIVWFSPRSAAQVIRIKDPLPPDYAGGHGAIVPAPLAVSPPEKVSVKTSSQRLYASFFGDSSAPTEGTSTSTSTKENEEVEEGEDVASGTRSYHDQRFINVLESCRNSLTKGCKQKLLQAYQVRHVDSYSYSYYSYILLYMM